MDSKIIIIIAAAGLLIAALILAMSVSSLRNWLVYAVSEAEKRFGGKTGKLKLRYVYDLAVEAYPALTRLIPFPLFGFLVDSALVVMRSMIDGNKAISDVISKE